MSHVVILEKYLNIMQSKVMAKANEIRQCKWKKKKSKRPAETLIVVERAIQRSIEKRARAIFIQAWPPIAIRDVGN
jgi:hypothetical protein